MLWFDSLKDSLFLSFILEKEEEGEREKETDLLFHLLICPLVDSCMWPDWDQTNNLGYQDNAATN